AGGRARSAAPVPTAARAAAPATESISSWSTHVSPRSAHAGPADAAALKSRRASALADRLYSADPSAADAPAALDPSAVVAPTVAVGVASPTVKDMAPVTVPTAADASPTTLEGREAGVRAAEVAGHRRALAGDARGRIVVPELGKIEVRAVADAAKIDVHVHAEEKHAKQVVHAHASELSAHVQREVPEARVFVERPVDVASDAFARDFGRNHGSAHRDAREERGEGSGARPSRTSVEEPSVRRLPARVRIVL
ncbi:MAG: hypothetical protein KF764_14340, partial [Labilithrix sp.]|nr:hypothetical protein [Labilithrix sp.]